MRYQDDVDVDLWRAMEVERMELMTVIGLSGIVVMIGLILLTLAMMLS